MNSNNAVVFAGVFSSLKINRSGVYFTLISTYCSIRLIHPWQKQYSVQCMHTPTDCHTPNPKMGCTITCDFNRDWWLKYFRISQPHRVNRQRGQIFDYSNCRCDSAPDRTRMPAHIRQHTKTQVAKSSIALTIARLTTYKALAYLAKYTTTCLSTFKLFRYPVHMHGQNHLIQSR